MTRTNPQITFIGLSFVFANVLTLLYFDPTYEGKDLPTWVYFSWSFGLFAYQSELHTLHTPGRNESSQQAWTRSTASRLVASVWARPSVRCSTTDVVSSRSFDRDTTDTTDAINTTLEVVLACHALGLNRSWWTVASETASLLNFYASTWEEYHTGTLYLSAFSGPVEGILMIVLIYLITALHPLHQRFWDTPIVSFIPAGYGTQAAQMLDKALGLPQQYALAELPINVAFMIFGAFGTVGNMINSYYNVIAARHRAGKAIIPPLFGLLPFGVHTAILVAWLHSSIRGGVELVHDARLLPFLLYWGMAAAYQVSQLILAHVTKSPFPYWNGMMIYSLFGAIDANAQWLFGR